MRQVLGFEGILHGEAQATVPKKYQGFGWEGGFTAHDAASGGTGMAAVAAATGSATVVGVDGRSPRLHAGAAGDFDLVSLVAGSAWNDQLKIHILAYDNHVLMGKLSVTVNKGEALTITFDQHFASIDKIVLRGRGGHDADPLDGGIGATAIFDDITVESPAAAKLGDWAL